MTKSSARKKEPAIRPIGSYGVFLPYVIIPFRFKSAQVLFRFLRTVVRDFFWLQFSVKWRFRSIPVLDVSHPLDDLIPFTPGKVQIYLNFTNFWIRPMTFLFRRLGVKKALPYFVSALMCGLSFAHTFVPPTPGPITCAAIMNISLGTMILFGILVGLPAFFISVFLYQKLVLRRKNYWNPQTDEMHDPVKEAEAQKRADALMRNPEKLPSLFESLFPILLPIVLILLNTVWRAVVGVDAKGVSRVPQFIQLIGGREVAMLLGLFAAMFICRRKDRMSSNKIADSITSAIGSCGTVLLITGLGGSFGARPPGHAPPPAFPAALPCRNA